MTATRTGLGKSHYIRDSITCNRKTRYERIPIYGDANRTALSWLHSARIGKQTEPVSIHYDVCLDVLGYKGTPKKESLNVILFDILFLNSLNRGERCLYVFN